MALFTCPDPLVYCEVVKAYRLTAPSVFWLFFFFFSTVAAGKIKDIPTTVFLSFMFILSQLKQHYY